VIFTTTGTVRLAVTPYGRKWGPPVIAPFADVVIDNNNDFNDGYILLRRTFKATATQQQLHWKPLHRAVAMHLKPDAFLPFGFLFMLQTNTSFDR
jgi:hypothetical protein